jgi:hypothetical protein
MDTKTLSILRPNAALLGLVALSTLACTPAKDDGEDTADTQDTAVEDTGEVNQDTGEAPQGDAALQGLVTGPDGQPVEGVNVALSSGQSAQTDASGLFSFTGLAEDPLLVALFDKDGFMSTTRIFEVLEETDRMQMVSMINRAPVQVFDASSSVDVVLDLGEHGHLTLSPGSLVDADGNPATGTASAYLTMINVQDKVALRASPGDFQAEMADGSAAWLESFGMSEILIVDANGEALALADGETAELAMDLIMPLKGRGEASQTIPFLIFDEVSGLWIDQGTGMTTDWQTYIFPIDEFGHWNSDQAYNTTCVKVRVEDSNGDPIVDVQVEAMGIDYTSYNDHFTNAAGFAYMLVRRDSELQATVYDQSGLAQGAQTIATPNTIGSCDSIEAATGVPLVGTFSL